MWHMIHGPLSREASQLKVLDVLQDNGWDWNWLGFDLPQNIKFIIQPTLIALVLRGEDKLAWLGSPQGNFDLKSAYKMAMGVNSETTVLANWIWNSNVLPRIQTFTWMCAHNSIGVQECLGRKGVLEDINYPLCNRETKSILHALCDCEKINLVWI